jgi:5-methylcytosine-specific restriction enzyme subunit McrC
MKSAANMVERVIISEWSEYLQEDFYLTPKDRMFMDKLSASKKGALKVDELKNGTRFSATSWVGVVRFEQLELHIIPKLAGENLGLIRLLHYSSGLNALQKSVGHKFLFPGSDSLFELVVFLFIQECEKVVRRGVWYDYVENEDALPVVRGRILFDRQMLKRFGQLDRIECRYEEHTSDIIENQIIAAALELVYRKIADKGLRLHANKLVALFQDICSVKNFNAALARSMLSYHRMNSHYREVHELAWLIFDALGIEDFYKPGTVECFAFLFNMNTLFEKFLRRWVTDLLKGSTFDINPKGEFKKSIIWDKNNNKPYSNVIPDILVWNRAGLDHRVAIDAKYKLYERYKVQSDDIYQLFLYAYAFGSASKGKVPTALLVYPINSPADSPSSTSEHLEIRNVGKNIGASLRICGIHIPTALDEAEIGFRGSISTGFLDLLYDIAAVKRPVYKDELSRIP